MTQSQIPGSNGERIRDNLFAEHPFSPHFEESAASHSIEVPAVRYAFGRLVVRYYKVLRDTVRLEEDVTEPGFLNNRKLGADTISGYLRSSVITSLDPDIQPSFEAYFEAILQAGRAIRSYDSWADYLQKFVVKQPGMNNRLLFNPDGTPRHTFGSGTLLPTYDVFIASRRVKNQPDNNDGPFKMEGAALKGLASVLPRGLTTTSIINRQERNNIKRGTFPK